MNQQNQGLGVQSSVPTKRKRGRPRKEDNVVHGVQKPENVLNFNQTAGTTNNSDSGMLGKTVTGVIEATFNDGYLVNIKATDSDSFFRGVVFLPGQVMPISAENDVAPHVQMINRKDFPIPMPNSQTNEVQVMPDTEENVVVPHVSQMIKQMFAIPKPNSQTHEVQLMPVTAENDVAPHVNQVINRKEFPIPMPNSQTNAVQVMPDTEENDVVPHFSQMIKQMFAIPKPNSQTNEVHGSLPPLQSIKPQIPVPLPGENVLPTEVHSSISVPPGISEAGHVNQSSCLNSEMGCDKTVEQSDKLHELNASTQVEEPGAAKESRPASETMNLFPTIENTDKQLRNEQVSPSVNQLNELVHDYLNNSNIELNLVTVSAEPESMPSEQISKPVENFVEKQNLPETNVQEDAKTTLVSIDTLSNVDNTPNSNGKPSTGIANILEMVPNQAVGTKQPESMQSEQVGQSDPYGNMLSSEGCNFMDKSDPQNFSSLGDVNRVDFSHSTESLVDAGPSDNQIGASTL